jgi:hypothetical protein
MKMINKKLALLPIVLTMFMTGCASIVSDSVYPVRITSDPDDAHFEIRNRAGEVIHSGITPSRVKLEAGAGYMKGETYTITFHKEGYADQQITLDSNVDGWFFGNLLLGGLIGMLIVDPLTGAMFKLPPNASASLSPVGAAPREQTDPDNLTLLTIDQVPEHMRGKLIPISKTKQ